MQQPAVTSLTRPEGMQASGKAARVLAALASLKLTATGLALLAAAIVLAHLVQPAAAWILSMPLALLAANLGAAVAVTPSFRRQAPLLVFHLALLVLMVLVVASRLTYFNAGGEVATGEEFAGELIYKEHGPLHRLQLDGVAFTNEGFEIDYAPGLYRGETRNRVRWRDAHGAEQVSVIGDHTPLVLEGYRFYTTSNKGFAPVFLWRPEGGEPRRGTVHMPSYPLLQFQQEVEWTPPDTQTRVMLKLKLDEALIDPEKASRFRMPSTHRIEIEVGGKVDVLAPGDAIALAGGHLKYEGLTTWMGYLIFYDWTLPWLLAASFVAAASLGWHYWPRVFGRPWT